MKDTTKILVKDQGTIYLLISKNDLINLLLDKRRFIVVDKKTVIHQEPWQDDKKDRIFIDEIAINKDYIITVL